ncbi:MAG: thioredoxin family protein [Candidatus Cloacimonetes bacterium]|nr:thioredoxin family protein [Candidatus Cloacimonadota bacterium]
MKKSIILILLTLFVLTLNCPLVAEVENNTYSSIIKQNFSSQSGNQITLEIIFDIPEGYHQTFQEEYFGIEIVDEKETGFFTEGKTFYPEEGELDEFKHLNYRGNITIKKDILISENAKKGDYQLQIIFYYQLCEDDGACLIPEEEYHNITVNVLNDSVAGATTGSNKSDVLKYLILAFVGGVVLNLMPCVLPILSIKAFAIVKQSQDSPRDIFLNGFLYTLGIIFSFIVLATVVTIIKLSGELVGWGFQFQNTGFVVFLLSLMFVFSLSLFDVFVFQAPGISVASQASGKKGYWGSFLTGIFAVLLATPCTAPFLGAALGFAFTQPPVIIYAIFILVGLGLGFPFLIIGVFPKAVKVFPKPGEWMNIFKEILGFLLLAFAVKMVQVILVQMGGAYVINVLLFLLILGLAAWMYGRFVTPMHTKKTQWIITFLAVLIIVFGAMLTLKGQAPANTENSSTYDSFWTKFSEEAIEQGISEGKPVFVDFTAAYCMVCKTNEATVINTSDIKQAFTDKGVLMLKGDYTKKDPLIHKWLQQYNKAGVPLYLLFVPGKTEPIVFPEIITKQMIFNALDEIK